MTQIIIFGAPGSGKGTQSEKIIAKYGFEHISTGDLFRKEIAQNTEIGRVVKELINKGQLVPDDVTCILLANRLNEISNSDAKGVVFDGFPRTLTQANDLQALVKSYGNKIDLVINLVVNEKELVNRMLLRGKTSGRSDDNLETIEKRLITYRNQTEQVLDFYKKDKKLVDIQGTGSIDEIFEKICDAIDAL